jgi:hypothetical protein
MRRRRINEGVVVDKSTPKIAIGRDRELPPRQKTLQDRKASHPLRMTAVLL